MKRSTLDQTAGRSLPVTWSLMIVMAVPNMLIKRNVMAALVAIFSVTVPRANAQLQNKYLPPVVGLGGSSQLPNQACPPVPQPSTLYSTLIVTNTRVVQVTAPASFRTFTNTFFTTTTLSSLIQNDVTRTTRVPFERVETIYRQQRIVSTRVIPGRDQLVTSTVYRVRVSTRIRQDIETVESTIVQPTTLYQTSVTNRQQLITQTVQREQVVPITQRVPGLQVVSTVVQQIVTTQYTTQPSQPVYRTSILNSVIRQTSFVNVPGRTISVRTTIPIEREVVATSAIISNQIIARTTTFYRQFERTLTRFETSIYPVTRYIVYTQTSRSNIVRTRYQTRTNTQTAYRDVQVTRSAPGRQVYSTLVQTDFQYVDVPGRIVNNVRTQYVERTNSNTVYRTQVVPRVESQRVVVTKTCAGGGYQYSNPSNGLQYGRGGSRGGRQYGEGSYGGSGSSNNEWKPILG